MNQKIRKIFIISIIGICIFCINLAVFFKFTEKDKSINNNEELIIDTVELAEKFNSIFDNKIDNQNNIVPATLKKDTTKDIIYTFYKLSRNELLNHCQTKESLTNYIYKKKEFSFCLSYSKN